MSDLERTGSIRHELAFGGVAFELSLAPEVQWQVSGEFARHVVYGDRIPGAARAPVVARVRCSVQLGRERPAEPIAGIAISQAGATTHVACDALRAEITREATRAFQARVWLGGEPSAANALLLGLSAAIIQLQGGLHLHAAALELDGAAVLFIGPSGAGKSTALELTPGTGVLAYDRVALARSPRGQWVAWSLPGGQPTQGRWGAQRALPVSTILRVRKGTGLPRLTASRGARRLFALRESVDVADLSPAAEEQRMATLERIAAELNVGEIETVLTAPHTVALREYIAGARRERPSRKDLGADARA